MADETHKERPGDGVPEAGRDDPAHTPEPPAGCEGCPGAPPSPERRRFLAAIAMGSGALASAALLVPWSGVFLSPLRRPDLEVWRGVGGVDEFEVGETRMVVYQDPAPLPWAGYAGRSGAWVRRESEEAFSAFTTYCTHLGCAVRWEEGARLFLCPCHGGAFHADGSVAAGPPPRPLDRYPIRVRDGRVEIMAMPMPEPGE